MMHYYNKILEASSFIRRKALLILLFWRFKIQDLKPHLFDFLSAVFRWELWEWIRDQAVTFATSKDEKEYLGPGLAPF